MATPRELARSKSAGATGDRIPVNMKYDTADLKELFLRSKSVRAGANVQVIAFDAAGQPIPGAYVLIIGDQPKLGRHAGEDDEDEAPAVTPAVA